MLVSPNMLTFLLYLIYPNIYTWFGLSCLITNGLIWILLLFASHAEQCAKDGRRVLVYCMTGKSRFVLLQLRIHLWDYETNYIFWYLHPFFAFSPLSCRSPAIVIAYLMKSKGWRLAQSLQWVKERWTQVDLSPGVYPLITG